MHQQQVRNPKPNTIQGLLIVLGLVAAIILDSFLAQILMPLIGNALGSLVFWAVGIALAMWTMRRFIMSYSYALTPSLLKITFAYGRYQRPFAEVYLNNILHTGSLEDMKKRYPGARVQNATRKGCALAAYAVAHRDNGRVTILLLQPDETIRAALTTAGKKK